MSKFSEWFGMRSAKQKAQDAQNYNRWAFPYGQSQRQKIESILKDLFPDEDPLIAMMLFLQGKEAYTGEDPLEGKGPRNCSEQTRIDYAVGAMKETLTGRLRKRLPLFLALIVADQQVDETLQYPQKSELLALAETMEQHL